MIRGSLERDMESVVETYPVSARQSFETLRALIHEVARERAVAPLTETLKWGEPAFLTKKGVGTTIRVAWSPKLPQVLQFLVNCKTPLIETWRTQFAQLTFCGNRAILLPLEQDLPLDALRVCSTQALTYHISANRVRL